MCVVACAGRFCGCVDAIGCLGAYLCLCACVLVSGLMFRGSVWGLEGVRGVVHLPVRFACHCLRLGLC